MCRQKMVRQVTMGKDKFNKRISKQSSNNTPKRTAAKDRYNAKVEKGKEKGGKKYKRARKSAQSAAEPANIFTNILDQQHYSHQQLLLMDKSASFNHRSTIHNYIRRG